MKIIQLNKEKIAYKQRIKLVSLCLILEKGFMIANITTKKLVGMGVALVTPFTADGSVDFDALGRLVEYQIKNKADYLVILGTTAETPTLLTPL